MKYLMGIFTLLFVSIVMAAPSTNRCFVDNQIEATASTMGSFFLVASANRGCLIIQNKGTSQSVYYNTVASTTATSGIQISAGTIFSPIMVPSNQVYLHTSSNSTPVSIFSGIAIP